MAVPEEKLVEDALGLAEPLYDLARYLTGSASEAEDLLQETYARAIGGAAGFQRGTNLKAWLFRILRNAFIDERRRVKRRGGALLPLDEEDEPPHDSWLRGDAELDGLRGVVADEIERALMALPEESRTVILLDYQGLNEREVAEVMGCALGTVKSRLARARAALRERLGDYKR
jgi:RNA polymerase sigma-70 factor (ECF subfamily)